MTFTPDMIEEIMLLTPNGIIPTKGSTYAACKDLYSPIDTVVPAMANVLIKTDIAISWTNPKYYMQLLSRSGLAYKCNITVQAGVIDMDYRKNIGVLLQNNSNSDFKITRGDRIAQYTYLQIPSAIESSVVDEFKPLTNNNRTGGFGSTG